MSTLAWRRRRRDSDFWSDVAAVVVAAAAAVVVMDGIEQGAGQPPDVSRGRSTRTPAAAPRAAAHAVYTANGDDAVIALRYS